jgi:amino acid adenylation domain-containing protein
MTDMQKNKTTSDVGQDLEVTSGPSSHSSPRTSPSVSFVAFREDEIEQSVPERFEQQARRHAHRLAVKSRLQALSYDELNQAANRVARAILLQRGEGNEPIALLMNNDVDMIVAIIATLKAGKIYVPLEPANPVSRNGLILQDSQSKLLVTNTQHLELARELDHGDLQVMNIDAMDPDLASTDPQLPVSPDAMACIIYTSGSTGQPKGVVTNHRNLLHRVMVMTNNFRIRADDRLTLMQSYSYGRSIKEVFGALLNGATLCPYDIRTEGLTNLSAWLKREGITYYGSVPTTFRYFVNTLADDEQFSNVRTVYLAGETVYQRDVEMYRKHFPPGCAFVHGFGATEAGTVMVHFLDRDTEAYNGMIPFSQVLEGFKVRLLDESGLPVGFDRTGELVISSPYLALGYWRRPKLTEATFTADPAEGRAWLLHTGDLGRMLPDGRLVHLGRRDFQVKIRGQRVEVAEVENALHEHAAVKEVVVSGFERHPGEKALVAHVVPNRLPFPPEQDLRDFLQRRLPEFMIPSAYVLLEALPLTVAGKVDRRALAAPDWSSQAVGQAFVAPRTPVEEVLAHIYRDVLDVEKVGIHDSFFELGGHSLLATQVVARVRDTLRVEIPLLAMFEAPTVADLSQFIITREESPGHTERIAQMLQGIKGLSAEEVTKMLQERKEAREPA